MARLLKLGMPPVKWETSRSCLFSKVRSHSIVSRWRVSDGSFSSSSSPSLFFLLHILDLFLLSLIDILFCFWKFSSCSSCCFLWFAWSGCCFLLLLVANSWGRGKVVSLSMKDFGAASRAAKSPLRLLLWKTCGIFSFQSANVFFFAFFSFFLLIRHLLVERQWFLGSETSSPWNSYSWCFSQKALKTSFKSPPSSFSAHSSRFSGDVFGVWKNWVGTLEFMKTWSRERQRVGSRWEGWKDDWVGSWAWLKDGG